MNLFQHVSDEISCYYNCVMESPLASVLMLLLVGAVLLFITSLFISIPTDRIRLYAGGQFFIIAAVWLSFTTMVCNSMFSINIYIFYTLTILSIVFLIPKIYDSLLVWRLNAFPIIELLDWPQEFIDTLIAGARVFCYDSAIPQAFASGKSVFLSVGLLEILTEKELKAVLAHESWHLMHNNTTHWLKQLSILTFMPLIRSDLELMADIYAINIVDREALKSARSKLFV